MDNSQDIRVLSLCAGYGGLELGLRRVFGERMRTVAYVEIEAFAVANLVGKMEAGKLDVAPVWTDIKTFDGEPFHGRVHGITAGYPCQPFSVAGKRQGAADRRQLWPYIAGIVQSVRPVWCFFENVPGHLTVGFAEVYRSLRLMGYSVEAGLFTAAECGAPHRRERLFILAYRECAGAGLRIEGLEKESTGQRGDRFADDGAGLPDAGGAGLSRAKQRKTQGQGQGTHGAVAEFSRWPARPGQQQYEWEEPRVVAEPDKRRHRGCRAKAEQNSDEQKNGISEQNRQHEKGQAQSSVGRAVDGTSCRVDRLRLLGNGVVPQCAEKAFRTLMGLFEKGV